MPGRRTAVGESGTPFSGVGAGPLLFDAFLSVLAAELGCEPAGLSHTTLITDFVTDEPGFLRLWLALDEILQSEGTWTVDDIQSSSTFGEVYLSYLGATARPLRIE